MQCKLAAPDRGHFSQNRSTLQWFQGFEVRYSCGILKQMHRKGAVESPGHRGTCQSNCDCLNPCLSIEHVSQKFCRFQTVFQTVVTGFWHTSLLGFRSGPKIHSLMSSSGICQQSETPTSKHIITIHCNISPTLSIPFHDKDLTRCVGMSSSSSSSERCGSFLSKDWFDLGSNCG